MEKVPSYILGKKENYPIVTTAPFLTMEEPYDQALAEVTRQLGGCGLRVMITFELQAARQMDTGCTCPHHGTDQCDCRLGVLLVYDQGVQPASLLAHSHEGKTWFSLVDTPRQPVEPGLSEAIRRILIRSQSCS